jgi:hypothetical protein
MPLLKKSPFPSCAESSVWLAIVNALQTDPILKSAVDTWQVWSNREQDTAEPTEENLPLCRVTSGNVSSRWLDESCHESDWQIEIEIGVEGCDQTHILDFWAAIVRALFTGNTLLNKLVPFGVIQKSIVAAAASPRMFGQKSGLAAKGALLVKMRVTT